MVYEWLDVSNGGGIGGGVGGGGRERRHLRCTKIHYTRYGSAPAASLIHIDSAETSKGILRILHYNRMGGVGYFASLGMVRYYYPKKE